MNRLPEAVMNGSGISRRRERRIKSSALNLRVVKRVRPVLTRWQGGDVPELPTAVLLRHLSQHLFTYPDPTLRRFESPALSSVVPRELDNKVGEIVVIRCQADSGIGQSGVYEYRLFAAVGDR